ncbi:MAG: hypothetical protein WA830_06965 [Candidatus Sulfotelmatobacter sp.]
MTRINAVRTIAETHSVAWGTKVTTWGKDTSALIFAAVLIICSVTVGCSSDKPKPVSSNNQIPVTQTPSPLSPMPAPAVQATTKAAPRKVVSKKPATVNYTDKTYGLTFEYPRRYAIETGSAATELLAFNPIPMNFVQPGGVALAAVELPETSFANTDFSSAFFNVSVHKTLTADQCSEFAVPQPKVSKSTDPASATTPTPAASPSSPPQLTTTQSASAELDPAASPEQLSAAKLSNGSSSKLMLGDLELRATEAVSGEGTRQSDSKYFHVFQNGACYEFALNVTTVASEDGVMKHVDRDKVFDRLEKILATVKINPVSAPEVTAEAPAQPSAETPAQ